MAYYRSYICENGHRNQQDFGSEDLFDNIRRTGVFLCARCDSTKAEIEVASPNVKRSDGERGAQPSQQEADETYLALGNPESPYVAVTNRLADTLRNHPELAEHGVHLIGEATPSEVDQLCRDGLVSRRPDAAPKKFDA